MSDNRRVMFWFPCFLMLLEAGTYASNDMYLSALPDMMHYFGVHHKLAQATLTAWFLGSASFQLILGPLSDRYGRRPVILTGGGVFIVSSFLCTLTHNIHWFLFFRFFQGSTVCAVTVAGYAAIHDIMNTEDAIRTIAWMSGIIILSPAAAPLLGGVINHYLSWHVLFYLFALIGIVGTLGLYAVMPESVTALNRTPIELVPLTKNYCRIFFNIQFQIYTCMACFVFTGLIAWLTGGPFLIFETAHLNVIWFGVYQALIFGAYIIGTKSFLGAACRFGREVALNIGTTLLCFGAGLMIVFGLLYPTEIPFFIVGMMFVAGGAGMQFAPLQRMAVDACREPMGLRMAMFLSIMSFFAVLGTVLVSIFYNKTQISLVLIIGSLAFCSGLVRLISWLNTRLYEQYQ